MNESIHVTVNELDQEVSRTVTYLKGLQELCKKDEDRMKAVQLLIEERARLNEKAATVVR